MRGNKYDDGSGVDKRCLAAKVYPGTTWSTCRIPCLELGLGEERGILKIGAVDSDSSQDAARSCASRPLTTHLLH